MNISNQNLGILLGGVLPALLFGFFAITMKAGATYKISTPFYLVLIGLSIALLGVLSWNYFPRSSYSPLGIVFMVVAGLLWGLGTLFVNFAIIKFNTPISLLVPLYNTNTLVAVLGGLLIFQEWRSVNSYPLFIGTFLIVVGSMILSKA